MKTLITTFAFAVMVFAFNADSAMATAKCDEGYEMRPTGNGWAGYCAPIRTSQIDELNDPDQEGNERDIADSGEEGSTSAAGANEQ
ncbi:MAG: hypothetical protein OXF05_02895 [Hyphomicrobiales bacterium]|nr:hypothetical protein [Hyphomicrobiales bacterium]